jgi:hypothetical protein
MREAVVESSVAEPGTVRGGSGGVAVVPSGGLAPAMVAAPTIEVRV